jgi:hypothetical protein
MQIMKADEAEGSNNVKKRSPCFTDIILIMSLEKNPPQGRGFANFIDSVFLAFYAPISR